jgi:hypothetical protein
MKLQLPDPEAFNIKDCVIAGDECVLVTPKDMGVDWNEDNKYFRSSIWRKSDMYPISLGYRKFVNYGEKPEFEPIISQKVTTVVKKDGSCLIVSKYKGQLIVRTRGTIDATKLDNGHEIAHLMLKYPFAFSNEYLTEENYTLLFEWTTPSNRIVLNETIEPTLWLIGIVIHHFNDTKKLAYKYVSQDVLDEMAKVLGVKRPETYNIGLFQSIEDIKKQIEPLSDIEGVVIYDESGQVLKKIKTLRYLQLHRVFTGVKNIDHIFNLFVEYGCQSRENFEALLATNYDWELVASLKELINAFYSRWKHIQSLVDMMKSFLNLDYIKCSTRKEQAAIILKAFPDSSGIAFAILDGRPIALEKLWKTFNEKSTTS